MSTAYFQICHFGYNRPFCFAVVCSVTWPLSGSEAGGDLALRQTSMLSHVNANYLASERLDLQNKSCEVCINARSFTASLPFKGQVTEQTQPPPPQAFRVTSAKRERLVTSAKREGPREKINQAFPSSLARPLCFFFSAERRLGTRQEQTNVKWPIRHCSLRHLENRICQSSLFFSLTYNSPCSHLRFNTTLREVWGQVRQLTWDEWHNTTEQSGLNLKQSQ